MKDLIIINIDIKNIKLNDIIRLDSLSKIRINLSHLGKEFNFGNKKLLHKNKPFINEIIFNETYFKNDSSFKKELIFLGKEIINNVINNLNNTFKNIIFDLFIFNEKEQNNENKILYYRLELF